MSYTFLKNSINQNFTDIPLLNFNGSQFTTYRKDEIYSYLIHLQDRLIKPKIKGNLILLQEWQEQQEELKRNKLKKLPIDIASSIQEEIEYDQTQQSNNQKLIESKIYLEPQQQTERFLDEVTDSKTQKYNNSGKIQDDIVYLLKDIENSKNLCIQFKNDFEILNQKEKEQFQNNYFGNMKELIQKQSQVKNELSLLYQKLNNLNVNVKKFKKLDQVTEYTQDFDYQQRLPIYTDIECSPISINTFEQLNKQFFNKERKSCTYKMLLIFKQVSDQSQISDKKRYYSQHNSNNQTSINHNLRHYIEDADNNQDEKENDHGLKKYSFINYNPEVLDNMFQKIKAGKERPLLLDKLTQLHSKKSPKSIFNNKNLKLYFGDNDSIRQWFKVNVIGKSKQIKVDTINKSNSLEPKKQQVLTQKLFVINETQTIQPKDSFTQMTQNIIKQMKDLKEEMTLNRKSNSSITFFNNKQKSKLAQTFKNPYNLSNRHKSTIRQASQKNKFSKNNNQCNSLDYQNLKDKNIQGSSFVKFPTHKHLQKQVNLLMK